MYRFLHRPCLPTFQRPLGVTALFGLCLRAAAPGDRYDWDIMNFSATPCTVLLIYWSRFLETLGEPRYRETLVNWVDWIELCNVEQMWNRCGTVTARNLMTLLIANLPLGHAAWKHDRHGHLRLFHSIAKRDTASTVPQEWLHSGQQRSYQNIRKQKGFWATDILLQEARYPTRKPPKIAQESCPRALLCTWQWIETLHPFCLHPKMNGYFCISNNNHHS